MSISENQNLDLSTVNDNVSMNKSASRNINNKFHTLDPQPIANISTNGNGVGIFKEPKQKVQALLSTIDNIQNNSSVEFMPSIEIESDCELQEELFDDYLRMEKSRHT